jgi:hypothetical protein
LEALKKVMYGAESWTQAKADINRLTARIMEEETKKLDRI